MSESNAAQAPKPANAKKNLPPPKANKLVNAGCSAGSAGQYENESEGSIEAVDLRQVQREVKEAASGTKDTGWLHMTGDLEKKFRSYTPLISDFTGEDKSKINPVKYAK